MSKTPISSLTSHQPHEVCAKPPRTRRATLVSRLSVLGMVILGVGVGLVLVVVVALPLTLDTSRSAIGVVVVFSVIDSVLRAEHPDAHGNRHQQAAQKERPDRQPRRGRVDGSPGHQSAEDHQGQAPSQCSDGCVLGLG